MGAKVSVYDRTSRDETVGQDAKAQYEDTLHRFKQAGFNVDGGAYDENVSGDTPWSDRPGLRVCRREGAGELEGPALGVREISRLWRGHPIDGLKLIDGIANLKVLDAPVWNRTNGIWDNDADADHLLRYIDLWKAWADKRTAERRSQLAIDSIKEGRRATKSGRPMGRPTVTIDREHLANAQASLQLGASLGRIHKELLAARGYYEASDPRTQKRRYVGRETLARALGLRDSAQNPNPPKTLAGLGSRRSNPKQPVMGKEETA